MYSEIEQEETRKTMQDTMAECPICAKQQGEVLGGPIYQDELVYAHHVYNREGPTFLGYVRAETRRHAPSFAELTPEEAQAVGLLIARLSKAIKACTGADHVYAFFYGDHVPHLHVHVFARYPGTPEEYWRERVDEWSQSPKGGADEVAALAQRLRDYLAESAVVLD
jgi:diadenosine tetraphosphate (Ap4A) HIT family hydrolase